MVVVHAGIDFKSMLRSGEYSDLTLVCQGKEFKIHKVVACPQSPVFSAAVSGKFKESQTGVIEIGLFDSETVRRMVEFLYTGNYDNDQAPEEGTGTSTETADAATPATVTSTSSSSSTSTEADLLGLDDDAASADDATSADDTSDDDDDDSAAAAACTHDAMIHVRVNAIADYYGIQRLTLLANQKVQQTYHDQWNAKAFLTSTREALDNTGDKKLHDVMAFVAAQHLEELVESPQMADLVGDFAKEILRYEALKFEAANRDRQRDALLKQEAAQQRLDVALAATKAAEAEITRLVENIDRIVNARDHCRNNACQTDFNCYVERLEGQEPNYVLRCYNCRCRHY